MQGKNENLTSAKTGEVISLPVYAEESLGLDNSQLAEDLAEEFRDKDFSRVSPAGIWFNKNNPVILDVVEAQAVLGNEINETIELGWNVKDETFAFRTIREKFKQERGPDLTGFQQFEKIDVQKQEGLNKQNKIKEL